MMIESLIRANAPTKYVIDSFLNNDDGNIHSYTTQEKFVSLILSISQPNHCNKRGAIIDWSIVVFLPSQRYIQKLVQRYTSQLEENNIDLEDDNLASLVCYFSMTRSISVLPDSTNASIVTFRIPSSSTKDDNDILQIRTFPYHNDVGVAKVWEAGACLAEYIIYNPHIIRGRHIIEIGAGVGLTGLVAAGVGAQSVHMTDYTEACLDNLAYNVHENAKWLIGRGMSPEAVTVGKLEWSDYSNTQKDGELISASSDYQTSIEELDLLLAADVVYDVSCIADLVKTVSKFLSCNPGERERIAIFATPFRKKSTFALFEKELERNHIVCTYEPSLELLPNVFPCYWNQPRTDVRVATMRLKMHE